MKTPDPVETTRTALVDFAGLGMDEVDFAKFMALLKAHTDAVQEDTWADAKVSFEEFYVQR